jgi:hypothetical protein
MFDTSCVRQLALVRSMLWDEEWVLLELLALR